MRPKGISNSNILNDIPPLPKNKSTVQLLADFMRYLQTCAKTYIQESHVNGTSLWTSVERTVEFVLTHPNGWEGAQQQMMRRAAILAGLIPDTSEGHARIRFVTEGEASLHFCIQRGLTTEALKVMYLHVLHDPHPDNISARRGDLDRRRWRWNSRHKRLWNIQLER